MELKTYIHPSICFGYILKTKYTNLAIGTKIFPRFGLLKNFKITWFSIFDF